MIRIQQLKMPLAHSEEDLLKKTAKKLKIQGREILSLQIIRQSIDARQKPDLKYVYTIDIEIENEGKILKKVNDKNIMLTKKQKYYFPAPGQKQLTHRPVIIGSGPAGLFCAYMLASNGYNPIIIERGDDANTRKEKVDNFWKYGILDTESNVQFGEGGAGTFSDGKLNTSVKDPAGRNHRVLELLVEAGAPAEILYQQKPHLGTDLLIDVIQTLRAQITDMGGEFHFRSQLTEIETVGNTIKAIKLKDGSVRAVDVLVCAIGHSARDTFEMLHGAGVSMSAKAFAVGVRIEHPQSMINQSQYGLSEVKELGAASYKLTHQLPSGRGIYSFCMCPGGYVVNASSEEQQLAVNGMSYHGRNSANANSAMIVTITPNDYSSYAGIDTPEALSGIAYQRHLEKAAFSLADGKVPIQLFEDFAKNQTSKNLGDIHPCTKGEWEFANLRQCLPESISSALQEGITKLNHKISGFARPDCILSGVESRTSSPVRIFRTDEFEGNIKGFYPCGEGAGYAGGITSAAIDGIKIAEAIGRVYKNII